MNRVTLALCLAALGAAIGTVPTGATGKSFFGHDRPKQVRQAREKSFQRVGTFSVYRNNGTDGAEETVAEIISATADGKMLVYTDGVRGAIGLIDIANPRHPQPLGSIALDPIPGDDTEYSPTSVDVLDNRYALVAVNTSASLTDTSGKLLVVDLHARSVSLGIELGGQPDSVKISPDRRYAAIVIENERSEDLCVGGAHTGTEVDEEVCVAGGGALGALPQTPFGNPPGHLSILRLQGPPASWAAPVMVPLTGLATYGADDPEPEFVDINDRNEAVVTLQENNHVVIVDLRTATVTSHFPLGTVTLNGVDATDDGVIALSETLPDVPREPDAVAWVPGARGRTNIATANEGDLFGGSRGFSILATDGGVEFDSGTALEELAVRFGHYPEGRSGNKGTEPEAIAYARYGHEDYLFVGSERGSFVAAYTLDRRGMPKVDQLLPAPLGPEGVLTIPQRNLLVVSGETDLEGLNARSTVMIYALERGRPDYPQIHSDNDDDGNPIPWSALSGLVSVPGREHTLLGVWDSAYANSRIFKIDVSDKPAVITDAMTIAGGGGNYDPEGIAIAPDGTLWIASEGNATDSRPNLLVQVDSHGQVRREIGLPDAIVACRAATTDRGTLGSGFEGVAVLGGRGRGYRLIVAQQRGWNYTTPACEDLDDDDGGLNAVGEPNHSRLWIYDPQTREWTWVAWELAPKPDAASWVGLSEITEVPGTNNLIVIERDSRTGDFAALKTLVQIDRSQLSDDLISHGEKATFDLLPALRSNHGWITDKPEGVAVTRSGRTYVVTDNDGVDDWNGETWFFDVGRSWRLFR